LAPKGKRNGKRRREVHFPIRCSGNQHLIATLNSKLPRVAALANPYAAIGSWVRSFSDDSHSNGMGICLGRRRRIGLLLRRMTGSTSNVVFGGTIATVSPLSNQPVTFRRTAAYAGRMSNGIVTGTLAYREEIESPSASPFSTASGALTLDTMLRVRAVPR
jgi:hypothetical protein